MQNFSDDQISLGDARECSNTAVSLPIDRNSLIQEVILSNCNWFQFYDSIEEQCGINNCMNRKPQLLMD